MSVDGQNGGPMSAKTGLPSSLQNYLPFTSLTQLHEEVENQAEPSRGISFASDVTSCTRAVCYCQLAMGQEQRREVQDPQDRGDPFLPPTTPTV